jgi:DNA-binding PucR family transcriptional regulator
LVTELAGEPAARESAPVAEDTLRVLVRGLHDGSLATEGELSALRAAAVRRAEEAAPLADIVAGCHVAARVAWGALVDEAGVDGGATLRSAGGALLRLLEQVTTAVVEAYLEEEQAIRGQERDARRALASALISGEHAEGPAARLGVRVAPAYVALALHIGLSSADDNLDADGAVVARQRLRRLQEQLDAFAGEAVLGLLDPTGGVVLLPATAERLTTMVEQLPALLTEIRTIAGTDVIAGAAGCVGVISVARAARQARDVLGIARRLDRPPGVYLLDDVLLEYQLTRDSDARPLLAGLLDPLDSNADLVHTLDCYFEHDLDRRGTAAELHVHPNTLDYRLRRISQLTGLDPGKPSGQQLLAAALTARRLV